LDDLLIEAIRNKNVILFVGAGVSANLGLPNWKNLISHMATKLGYDPEVYNSLGDNLSLAEYYIRERSIGELRSWMDREWHNQAIQIEKSDIHRLIVQLDFPIIYTTNYDRWLERAFEHYNKKSLTIKNVGDLRNIQEGVTQIVKFHGDFDDDSSIVLTESSYFERFDFESPLDIKLRADILGKTVLFIGYSLSDINIRYLLYKLHKTWQDSAFSNGRPSSYIFFPRPNPIQEKVLGERGIKMVSLNDDDPASSLKTFLETLLFHAYGIKNESRLIL
jgi:hypothetical protein